MSEENSKFEANNAKLEEQVGKLTGEVDKLSGENAKFAENNKKLEENVNKLSGEVDQFSQENEKLALTNQVCHCTVERGLSSTRRRGSQLSLSVDILIAKFGCKVCWVMDFRKRNKKRF